MTQPNTHSGQRSGDARTLNRRRLAGAAALTGAAGLTVLAGCRGARNSAGSSHGQASGAATPAQPRSGGTITVSYNFRRGFDPHTGQPQDTGIMGLFYQTLVRNNPKTWDIEPELATKWEVPSQTELVFTLAPGIKWQDKPPVSGRPLKVDDVIYSYQRAQSPDPRFINKSFLAGIDQMQAVDDHTLKLTLKQPDVTQLSNLAIFSLAVLASEVVDAAKGNFATAGTVVGTGAFVLQTSEMDVGSSLSRTPNYWKSGLPYLDKVQLHAFQDYGSEWSAFLAGQLDHRFVPGENSAQFASQKQNQYRLDWFGDLAFGIAMPNTTKKPLDDPRVTRALRLLIDHDGFKTGWADNWWGRSRFSACFAAATADQWDLSEDEYRQHLEWKQPKDDAIKEALSLLNAAGFSKANPARFTVDCQTGNETETSAGQLTQAQFKQNSQGAVDPTLRTVDATVANDVRARSDFDYWAGGHSSGGTDPDTYFTSTYKTGGGRNYGKLSDPKLDDMIAKQRTIFDEQERKKAVRDIVLYMIDNIPYSTLVSRYLLNAVQLRVHDFAASSQTFDWGSRYETVWVDR
jgi:peptide/nickel transport system substrate-binding protein